jgi:hypothetical protein
LARELDQLLALHLQSATVDADAEIVDAHFREVGRGRKSR